jgi:hypothetical protein
VTFGGIKHYNLVLIDFSKSKYFIYEYDKDRRLTAKQAWNYMRNNSAVAECNLTPKSTIFDYDEIVAKHELDSKHCDRYIRFKGFS